ncbi:hypothetical protein PI95_022495 [Hassallia byssoidea VB512170]|uniref:Novel STAND NTPase 1 domain-containing protein n=1 Tax=Hassallia byssoidea VB512170 TaxID=1304833 RepID=A0A846HCX4_9CYAN|nr:WD40 repeat domain-containing protein [Hassalia byssoidea]NEU75252.1 hypothetical protein [Hassalia byssoidea VB512170]
MISPEPKQIPEKIVVDNERSLRKLARSITNSQENFVLIIARCNYRSLQDEMVQRLKQQCPMEIQELHLSKSVKTLFTTIQAELKDRQPPALMIFGLELVEAVDQVLISTNQVREEFRKNFPFPIVLWVNDEIFQKLIRRMPDFKNWTGNSIKFEIDTNELITNLQSTISLVFSAILNAVSGIFLDNASLNLDFDTYHFLEMELAVKDLQKSMQPLAPELAASIQFLLGREADASNNKSEARSYYEQSLGFWQQRVIDRENSHLDDIKRYGCVLLHLGLWWRQYANIHRSEHRQACEQAKEYFQKCVDIFEQHHQQNLAAKYINLWGEVLTQLAAWDEVEKVATQAINLHKAHPEPVKLGYSYGLMAEVALQKLDWMQAKEYAELALQHNDIIVPNQDNIPANQTTILDWQRKNFRNIYLLLLAQAQQHLEQISEAISHLETARFHSNPQLDPLLYIRILSTLQKLYFDESKYLEAFDIKQELRSIEQQYGLRAFVGAGRLQSRRQVANFGLGVSGGKADVSPEIAASGRLQDVNRLIERIGRPDCKLTVVYGQSGVGKSSLVQAGLLPALKQKSVEARDVVPVLLQVYTDWAKTLGSRFVESIEEVKRLSFPHFLDTMAAFTTELKKNIDNNSLTVLIFDQFEEFFFAYKDPVQRQPFFEFIRDCLNIPYVKIILSLREDYLHYLLECDRLVKLDAIDCNILDKKILYYLGNFSPEDARSVIENLTESSQFHLDVELIDELVRDLASNFNEVRPIELQVVGAQLQTEKITTLAQYQEYGPKEELVGRFLEEVVKDCGHNNEQFAKLVLYILTDENNTRPLKNRAEIEAELALETERLDLILKILVKSGLVFQVPGFPSDRYQLVHDYLVPFVRQQQSERLIKELEKEREQRKLTEAKLNEVLRQQLIDERKGLAWKVSLGVITGAFAIFLPLVLISQNNSQLMSMSNESQRFLNSNNDLEALVQALKAGKRIKQWWSIGVSPEVKMQVTTALQDVVYTIRERNSLEGHKDTVTKVSYSPDGKMIASGSADGVVKVWQQDGIEIATINNAHEKKITNLIFSPDNKKIISGSEDKTLKLWDIKSIKNNQINTKPISIFARAQTELVSASFSPNGQTILSGAKDGRIILWNLDGKVIKDLPGHQASVTSVNFSPDGQRIVSASLDNTAKLWNREGKEIKSLIDDIQVRENLPRLSFSPDGQTINSNFGRLWRSDGSSLNTGEIVYQEPSMNFKFSPDSKIIAFGSANNFDTDGENSIIVSSSQTANREFVDYINLIGHRNKVTDISFNPALDMLASVSEDRTIKLWSLEKKSFKPSEYNSYDYISNISFSPSSQLLATIYKYNDEATLWQRNGSLFAKLPGNNVEVNFSADRESIVSASQETNLQIWQSDGKYINTLQGSLIQGSFSNNGKMIALSKSDNTVEIYSSEGKQITTLKGHKDTVEEISFSPDGKKFATRSRNKTIKLWQRDGKLITSLLDYGFINYENDKSMGFSADSKTLALWSNDNTLRFVGVNGKNIKILKQDRRISVKFSPDGDIAIVKKYLKNSESNAEFQLEVWNSNGNLIKNINLPNNKEKSSEVDISFLHNTKQIAISSNNYIQYFNYDGSVISSIQDSSKNQNTADSISSKDLKTKVFYSAGSNKISIWNIERSQNTTIQLKTRNIVPSYNSPYPNIILSDDAQILAVRTNERTVELWRSDGTFLEILQTLPSEELERFGDYLSDESLKNSIPTPPTIFSADNKTFASRINENEVQFWHINSYINQNAKSKLIQPKTVILKTNFIESINAIPNSDKIAIVTNDDVVKLWQISQPSVKDTQNNVQLLKTLRGHKNIISSVSISPDGSKIASASYDNTVKIWQRDGQIMTNFTEHKQNVNSVSFNHNGTLVASGSDDKTVKVWQPTTGKVIKEFKEHGNGVTGVSFSPDGKLIASASKDSSVKLWSLDSQDNKSLNTFNVEEPVSSVSFSPDGKIIAAAGSKKIKLFNIEGSLLATYERLGSDNVSFSPDGKSIAAAYGQEGVSVWDFDLDYLLKRGCSWAHDYLRNNPKVKPADRNLCQGIAIAPKSN